MSETIVRYGGYALGILAVFLVGFFLYRKYFAPSPSSGAQAKSSSDEKDKMVVTAENETTDNNKTVQSPAPLTAPPVVYELQDKDIGAITKKNENVVLLLYTPSCPYCQRMAPEYDKLAAAFPTLTFSQLNAQNFGPACRRLGVERYPTMLLFKNGAQVSALPGFRKAEEFIADLRKSFMLN